MAFELKFLKYYAWGVSQFLIGADEGKQRLHFETLQPKPGAKILDVGCATGNASAVFKDFDYTGIDLNAGSIAFAAHRFRQYPNMQFLCMDLHDLDKPAYYDYIMFGSTGHHIPNKELAKLFGKFRDLLKPDGIIGIVDQVKTGHESRYLQFVMSIDQGKFHKTVPEYLDLIAKANLKVLDQKIVAVKGPCIIWTNTAAFRLAKQTA
jgi:cyclopropane fatty-acyl-phospholipid synthase-like methyltransferase